MIRTFGRRAAYLLYRKVLRALSPADGPVLYSGIKVGVRKRWDRYSQRASRRYVDVPDYEATLLDGLRSAVRMGDSIVVVGGGWGVTAVFAGQRAGPSGSVLCYEADVEGVQRVRATARSNGATETVRVIHATVGEAKAVYGSSRPGPMVDAKDLPKCDILELDCEGAEAKILAGLTFRPREILVECHGHLGTPSQLITVMLEEMGYAVENLGLAEPRLSKFCLENDITVLRATRTDAADAIIRNGP